MYLLLPSTANGHTLPIVFGHTVSAAQDMGHQAAMVRYYLALFHYLIRLLQSSVSTFQHCVQELHPVQMEAPVQHQTLVHVQLDGPVPDVQ